MKRMQYLLCCLSLVGANAMATEVITDPNVAWYDTNRAGVLSIYNSGAPCASLKADPTTGLVSAPQVRLWVAQLDKAKELGLSLGIGYDAHCAIEYVARSR